MKNVCITDDKKTVIFVSPVYPGKEHDKTIFLNEKMYKFLPDSPEKLFDSAFQGLEKDCPDMTKIIKPVKRKKGQLELNNRDKKRNKKISSKRVIIENAFSGVKRLKITWDIFRNIKYGFSYKIFLAACAIWNFHLSNSNV